MPNITETKFQSILTIRRAFSKVWFFVQKTSSDDKDDKKLDPLCIMLPKMNKCTKS